MKTKGKVLIGLMALCLAGTAGAAFAALNYNETPANKSFTEQTDKAIYLDWDSGSKSGITAVNQLAAGQKDYRSLSVVTSKTSSVTGTVTVTFTLTPATEVVGKTATLSGLALRVHETESLEDVTVENYAFDETDKTPSASVTGGTSAQSDSIAITLSSGASATKHYVLVFAFSTPTMTESNIFSGHLTIAQSYSA